jgi:outer membrane immunogenic protein
MRRSLAYAAFALAAATAWFGPALAADKAGPAPAAATVAELKDPWTGPYIGAVLGHAAGLIRDETGFAIPRDGYTATGLIGYNHRLPGMNGILIGAEADIGATDISGATNPGGFQVKGSTKWLGSLRARVGYGHGSTMLFATGGVAMSNGRVAVESVGAVEAEKVRGIVYGAGIESFLFGNLGIRIEWLRFDWRGAGYTNDVIDAGKLKANDDHVRAGLIFRL